MQQGLRKALRPRRGWPVPVLGALALLGAGGTASALGAGSGRSAVRLGPAAQVAAAKDLGAVAAGVRMDVTVVLKARDPAGLAAYARAVAAPGSPLYHDYQIGRAHV